MPRLRLDMTLKELLDKLTSEDTPNPNATAGWVNIRRDGFPWRHMVADAEAGTAEVSRVGRKLMAREAEIDRWLSTKRITGDRHREPGVPPRDGQGFGCGCGKGFEECARCHLMWLDKTLRNAGWGPTARSPSETEAKVAAIEEQWRLEATPEYRAQREAKRVANDEIQKEKREREQAAREPRQQGALAYLTQNPSITVSKHLERNRGVTLHRAMRDLNALVEAGALRREGKGEKARYFLPTRRIGPKT